MEAIHDNLNIYLCVCIFKEYLEIITISINCPVFKDFQRNLSFQKRGDFQRKVKKKIFHFINHFLEIFLNFYFEKINYQLCIYDYFH